MEDLDPDRAETLAYNIKLWADRYNCPGETKGGMVALTHKTFIVTSQFTIIQCFGRGKQQEHLPAIQRRFQEIHFPTDHSTWDPVNPPSRDTGGPAGESDSEAQLFL